jgi:RND family efflux transporter MFP subunit
MRQRLLPHLALVLLLCAASCDRSQPAPPQAAAPPVTVQTPSFRSVETFDIYAGETAATESVEIRARLTGFLESVNFEPSQVVEQGDLLFTIESGEFEARLAAAQASLAQAEAARDLMRVTRDKAQTAFDRGGVSEIELEEAKAKLEQAEATVQSAKASVDSAELQLSYTQITAPLSGRISRELVSIGNLLSAAQGTLLTTIVQDDPINVYFELNERQLLRFLQARPPKEEGRRRDTVRVQLELLDGTRYEQMGTIDFAENRIDPSTGTLEVRATFPNDSELLYPGMFVRLLLPRTGSESESCLIPEVALMRDLAGPFVLVVGEQNIVERRSVELGERLGEERLIVSGLNPEDRVIVNGLQRAIPGNPVAPQEAAASEPTEPAPAAPADEQNSDNDSTGV